MLQCWLLIAILLYPFAFILHSIYVQHPVALPSSSLPLPLSTSTLIFLPVYDNDNIHLIFAFSFAWTFFSNFLFCVCVWLVFPFVDFTHSYYSYYYLYITSIDCLGIVNAFASFNIFCRIFCRIKCRQGDREIDEEEDLRGGVGRERRQKGKREYTKNKITSLCRNMLGLFFFLLYSSANLSAHCITL